MATPQGTIIQEYNKLNPLVKLSYELFEFPVNDEPVTANNLGFIVAFYFRGTAKFILNTTFKKGVGLDRIEVSLIKIVSKNLGVT